MVSGDCAGSSLHSAGLPVLVLAVSLSLMQEECLVEERCYSNADCRRTEICFADGRCGFECSTDVDCGAGLRCSGNRCIAASAGPLLCPDDMVSVADAFCIDRFEAARKDATETVAGTDESIAVSRKAVVPWQVRDNATAQGACEAAGKTLCAPQQWRIACEGSAATTYGYGNVYEPGMCNGIDLFGREGFQLLPTGSLPDCKSDWGVYDINGNLWEHVAGGTDRTIRGGAYNCIDSQTLHRCDYVPGNWTPSARGFRCCKVMSAGDAGLDPSVSTDASAHDVPEGMETGCVVEDAPYKPIDGFFEAWLDRDVAAIEGGGEGLIDVASEAVEDSDGKDAPDVDSQEAEDCPTDMVQVQDFCMDRYEASHADATAILLGASPVASSAPGVLPWFPVALPEARSACEAAGKRLCLLDEWIQGCTGSANSVYSYGNSYQPTVCNGIDTFCLCSSPACSGLSQCPYPHCYNLPSTEGPGPCGSQYQVAPTGYFSSCVSEFGAYDVNGNVWELADSYDGLEHFRGGAYNCLDSERLHRCDHDGTWAPSAKGFRCCRDRAP